MLCIVVQTVRLWAMKTGTCVHDLREHEHVVECVAFSLPTTDAVLNAFSRVQIRLIFALTTQHVYISVVVHPAPHRYPSAHSRIVVLVTSSRLLPSHGGFSWARVAAVHLRLLLLPLPRLGLRWPRWVPLVQTVFRRPRQARVVHLSPLAPGTRGLPGCWSVRVYHLGSVFGLTASGHILTSIRLWTDRVVARTHTHTRMNVSRS